jgi:hypothetical protein
MKNIVTLLMAALLAISATQAQTSTTDNPLFRHIPADADQVYAIHIAGLIGKVDMMSLMKLAQSQKFGKDNPMSYLSDISNTGIDLRQDIIIAQKTPLNTDSPTCVSILAHLTDSGKFVAFLRKNEKEIHFMHIQGKVRSATSGKQAYAWDDKLVTMVVIKHSKGQAASIIRSMPPTSDSQKAFQTTPTSRSGTTEAADSACCPSSCKWHPPPHPHIRAISRNSYKKPTRPAPSVPFASSPVNSYSKPPDI